MTKIELAKATVSTIVAFGAGRITYSILNNNVDEPENIAQAVSVPVASFVIAGMAADYTSQYSDKLIDEIVVWWKTNVTKNA